jgi:hypothetical protein
MMCIYPKKKVRPSLCRGPAHSIAPSVSVTPLPDTELSTERKLEPKKILFAIITHVMVPLVMVSGRARTLL